MGEPWIRVHAQLLQKPVVGRAAVALGVSRHEAVGVLVAFWGAVSQLATNGRVGHYEDEQLEAWALWTRKRGKFAAFLRAQHLDADGRVNEWDEYAGPLESRREKDRDRKRRSRGLSGGSHADGHADIPADVTQTSALTRANETKRNETKELREEETPPEIVLIVNQTETALIAQYGPLWESVALFLESKPLDRRYAWVKEIATLTTSYGPELVARTCNDALAAADPVRMPSGLRSIAAGLRESGIREARPKGTLPTNEAPSQRDDLIAWARSQEKANV